MAAPPGAAIAASRPQAIRADVVVHRDRALTLSSRQPGRGPEPLPFELQALVAVLSGAGQELRAEPEGGVHDDLGISIYAPGEDLEAVAAFRWGYYEDDG
jgi:hypothetical protein